MNLEYSPNCSSPSESSLRHLETTVTTAKENTNTLSLNSNRFWLDTADSTTSSISGAAGVLRAKVNSGGCIVTAATATAAKTTTTTTTTSPTSDPSAAATPVVDGNPKNMATPIKEAELNNTLVRGRPSACVFVASLCSTLSDDELSVSVTNHFQQWGTLATVKVLRDTCNRPYAFVQYTTDEESKLAIEKGHNSVLDGRNIRCEAAKVNRTLFLSSKSLLNRSVIEDRLSAFGELEDLVPSTVKGEIYTNVNAEKGYKSWFCKFVYRDDAIRAYANLTEEGLYKIEWTQNIDKSSARKSESEESDLDIRVKFDKFSVFVGQLNPSVLEHELSERFERHGEILDLNLVKKTNNTFAFIKFKEESSAASAVERENHSMFCGKTMHVQYRETHPSSTSMRARGSGGGNGIGNSSGNGSNFGIALAPPPINLNKRSFGKNEFGKFHSKEFNKPKFNGCPSNSYNKGYNKFKSFKNFRPANNVERKFDKSMNDLTWQASQLNLKSEVSDTSSKKSGTGSTNEGSRGGGGGGSSGLPGGGPVGGAVAGSGDGSRGTGMNSAANSYPPPHTAPGFPLFYYVPAENVGFTSTNSNNSAQFYNLYPQYYPHPHPAHAHPGGPTAPSGGGMAGTSAGQFGDVAGGRPPSSVTNVIGGGAVEYPAYGMANYVYYPTEAEIASHEKKT
ncbi:Meiotic activator RIM4 [Candida viswanathii]|uniref:Meiotic activator RIM4 n=1 Tax=Candida viswanathii TaxID=5486 RepID=A0A367XZK2_9ASCO|nr:Meiotic activator RIM4 [Candida viswanathii]